MPTSSGTYNTSTITYDQSSLSYDGYDGTISNLPAVGVFIDFTNGPYAATNAWVDVTTYVREINIRRGRSDETEDFPSGSARLTLDNRARVFDPFNTSSPYNGQLTPRRAIKITSIWNSIEYVLFKGYIAGWPVTFTDAGYDSTISLDCFDLFGLIGATTIGRNFVEDYTMSLGPVNFFPMSEQPALNQWADRMNPSSSYYLYEAGSTVIYPTGGGYTIPWSSSSFYQTDPLKAGISTPSLSCRSSFIPLYINCPQTGYPGPSATSSDFSITFAMQMAGDFQMNIGTIQITTVSGNLKVAVAGAAPQPTVTVSGFSNRPATHVTIAYSLSANQFTVYVDGDAGTTSTTVGSTGGIFPLLNNGVSPLQWLYINAGTQVQHLALFNRALSQTEARNLAQATLGLWDMTTINRASYYFSGTPLPASMYSVSSNIASNVSEMITDASPLLPALRDLNRSEGGELFVDRNGVIQLFSKNDVFSLTRCITPQFTITDTGTGVYYDKDQVRMQWTADRILNYVTVNGTNAQTVVSDATSISTYGSSADVIDTLLRDINETTTLANRQLAVWKNPRVQIDPFSIKGQRDPSYVWSRILNMELLDRFTFKRTPSTGSAFSQDMLIQSIEHRITPSTWETTLNGSGRYTNWFIINQSLIGGTDLLLN